MNKQQSKFKRKNYLFLGTIVFFSSLIVIILLNIAIAFLVRQLLLIAPVSNFKQHQIKHLYLLTSDFHLPRARAIGSIILGSRGIVFTPMEIRTKRDREPMIKIIRDIGRSILWIFSGYTGSSLKDI